MKTKFLTFFSVFAIITTPALAIADCDGTKLIQNVMTKHCVDKHEKNASFRTPLYGGHYIDKDKKFVKIACYEYRTNKEELKKATEKECPGWRVEIFNKLYGKHDFEDNSSPDASDTPAQQATTTPTDVADVADATDATDVSEQATPASTTRTEPSGSTTASTTRAEPSGSTTTSSPRTETSSSTTTSSPRTETSSRGGIGSSQCKPLSFDALYVYEKGTKQKKIIQGVTIIFGNTTYQDRKGVGAFKISDRDTCEKVTFEKSGYKTLVYEKAEALYGRTFVEMERDGTEVADATDVSEQATTATPQSDETITISGTVVDEYNEPIIGANIFVNGTRRGTATDANGNFTIDNVPKNNKIVISYVGHTKQEFTASELNNKTIIMTGDTTLNEPLVCGATNETKAKGILSFVTSDIDNKCYPSACIEPRWALVYEEYDEDGEGIPKSAKCVEQKCEIENATAEWQLINGVWKCVATKCPCGYELNSEKQCVEITNPECTKDSQPALPDGASTAVKECDATGKTYCKITACDENHEHDAENNRCISKNKKPCTHGDKNATSAEYRNIDGTETCFITTCQTGWEPSADGTKCQAAKILSKEDSEKKVQELQENAEKMREREQSTENKLLGAAGIGATGIGGMMLAQSAAENAADDDAERAMRAYLATFRCDYGGGKTVRGGEQEIELPGGNELINLYSEYIALANDLKLRKEQLGLKPGIESEPILDGATSGLYDDIAVGKTGGAYTSLARALMDPKGADAAAWAAQRAETAKNLKTGAITAGVGAGGSMIGNLAINSGEDKKNKANEIERKYDAKKVSGDTINANKNTPTEQ